MKHTLTNFVQVNAIDFILYLLHILHALKKKRILVSVLCYVWISALIYNILLLDYLYKKETIPKIDCEDICIVFNLLTKYYAEEHGATVLVWLCPLLMLKKVRQ